MTNTMTSNPNNRDSYNFRSGDYTESIFYAKRELDAELRRAVPRQLLAADSDEFIHVLEWFDFTDTLPGGGGSENTNQQVSRVLGCGISSRDGRAKCMVTDCQVGLYVCSWQLSALRVIASIYGYSVETYEHLGSFNTNNFNVFDALHAYRDDPDYSNDENDAAAAANDDDVTDFVFARPATLCKIVTPTFEAAQELHKVLRTQYIDRVKEYAAIPFYWDLYRFVLYELRARNNGNSDDDHRVIKTWLNDRLQRPSPAEFAAIEARSIDTRLPYITFDVETSSSDDYRVPTGEDVDDVLVTAAIYHQHTETMYSLAYLPMDKSAFLASDSCLGNSTTDTTAKSYRVQSEFFFDERDILARTMELLDVPDRYHYLVGYNSAGYDIKYLLARCVFYDLPMVDRFVYKHCYAYGVNQIHIDMFRVALMQYDLKDYKLATVAQYLLGTTKDDVNAVDIRFTYAYMARHGEVPDDTEHGRRFLEVRGWPSVKDIVDYNEKDTLLVYDIVRNTNFEKYVDDYALDSGIALSSLNENYKRVKYPLICWCEKNLLRENTMMSHFKESTRQLTIPILRRTYDRAKGREKWEYDYRCVKYDSTSLLGMRRVQNSNKQRYPGGVNYCYGAVMVDNVVEYDYVQAYLRVIVELNLSDETCAVIKASALRALLAAHTRRRAAIARKFRAFDYRTHNGDNKIETRILTHQFIYENVNCGSEFSLADDAELARRGDEPVILILCDRRGVLSRAVQILVDTRNTVKTRRNTLQSFLGTVDEERAKLVRLLIEEDDELVVDNDTEYENLPDYCHDDSVSLTTDDAILSTVGDYCGSPITIDDEDDEKYSAQSTIINESCVNNEASFYCDDDNYEKSSVRCVNGRDIIASPIYNEDDDEDDNCIINYNDNKDDNNENILTNKDESSSLSLNAVKVRETTMKKYAFENEYVYVHNDRLVFSMPAQWSAQERVTFIDTTKRNIDIEIANYTNRYLRLKTITLSVYGIVGSLSMELAAVITAIPRMTLIQQAQLMAQKGRKVYYLDTDCIHTDGEGVDESKALNTRFTYAQLDSKPLGVCIYQCCKTYYRYVDGAIKYGANRRGPPAWRYMVEFFDQRARDIVYLDEIRGTCRDFFTSVYERVYDTCCATRSFEAGFEFLTRDIKLSTYTPTVILRDYLRQHYPEMASTLRQRVFLVFNHEDITSLIFRPALQLFSIADTTLERDGYFFTSATDSRDGDIVDRPFDHRVKIRLLNVNLFKFFLPVITTCYNIVFTYCRENNKPYHIILHPRHFSIMIISGYLDAMRTLVERWRVDSSLIPSSSSLANDEASLERLVESEQELNEQLF